MTIEDLNQAVAVLTTLVSALRAAVPGSVGRTGAAFRYACGDLLASAPTYLQTASLSAPMTACFSLAVAAGATVDGIDAARVAMTGTDETFLGGSPSYFGQAGILVATAGIRMALIAESQILAATTFSSSNDAYAALAQINLAFEHAEEYAADNHDPAVFQALIALNAAVARDITTRAAPLPSLTTYAFLQGTTSHALAYRLYGDAGRCDELRAENGVIAPAIMPASGIALTQ